MIKITTRTVLFASATLWVLPVFAQTPATKTPAPVQTAQISLEEIVVTAQRRESRLQDTPISITALSSKALEAQGISTVNDLAANVPNLTSTTGPQGSSDANFFIRGVGQYDVVATNDPGVGVYVDGVYLGRTVGAMLDSGDIGRVEVLRGPQGTLFGRNTLGGAVSVTSKAPKLGELGANIRGTYGSRNRLELDGSINAPLGDLAALRVYAFTRDQDGFATDALNDLKFGKTKRHGGKLQLLVKPVEGLSINLAADYALDKSNPAPSVLLAIAPFPFFPADAGNDRSTNFYTVFSSNRPEARNKTYGFSGTIAYQIDGATLKSITAYRKLDSFSTSDPDGTGYRLYDQNVPTNQNQFSQELQVSGKAFDNKLDYLAGAYFFRERVNQILQLCFAPITPLPAARFNACNTWNQGNDQTTKSYALFGEARYHLTDQLSVTAGGRYTWETKTDISNQTFDFRPAGAATPGGIVPGFVLPIVTNLPGTLKFQKFTPKLGVEFKATDKILVFADYSKGFRSGGFNGRLIAPQATIPTYNPDTNDSFELGIKSDINRMVRINATLFYSKYKDIQQTISDPAVQFRVANAGNAALYGFEAEATVLPVEGLQLTANLGYTNSKFENVPVAVGPINGNSLPFSPRLTMFLGAEYAINLGDTGKVTPRIGYRYQSRTYFTAFNDVFSDQKGYGLLSARITWADTKDRFSVSVYGDNITDKTYFTFGQNALAAQGVAYSYLGRPREFGITIGAKY